MTKPSTINRHFQHYEIYTPKGHVGSIMLDSARAVWASGVADFMVARGWTLEQLERWAKYSGWQLVKVRAS
jgi:hypothetical protein